MNGAKLIIWDVQHGSAVTLKTPDGKVIWFDAGCGSYADGESFSPLRHYNAQTVHGLCISHPHYDHIADLKGYPYHNISTLLHNLQPVQLGLLNRDEDGLYLDILAAHQQPVDYQSTCFSAVFNGGVHITNYSVDSDLGDDLNHYSVVAFVTYGQAKMCIPGDMTTAGWGELFKDDAFVDEFSAMNIFLAPHHGRESGWHDFFPELCTPEICIISDGAFEETSIAEEYSNLASGLLFNGVRRKRLTTYSHGCIVIDIPATGTAIVKPSKGV